MTPRRSRRRLPITALALLTALMVTSPAAAGPDEEAIIVPLGMTIENRPNPVLGADGKNHLAYEITIVNQTPSEVTIGRVQARAGGRPLGAAVEGAELESLLRVNSGGGPAIPGGGSALLFMDVTYPKGAPTPKRLTHAFSVTLGEPPGRRPAVRLRRSAHPRGPEPGDRGGCAPARLGLGRRRRLLQPDLRPSRRDAVDRRHRARPRALRDRLRPARRQRAVRRPGDRFRSYDFFGDPIYPRGGQGGPRRRTACPSSPGARCPRARPRTGRGQPRRRQDGQGPLRLLRAHAAGEPAGRRRATASAPARSSACWATPATPTPPHLHFHIMDGPRRSSRTGSRSCTRGSRARDSSPISTRS